MKNQMILYITVVIIQCLRVKNLSKNAQFSRKSKFISSLIINHRKLIQASKVKLNRCKTKFIKNLQIKILNMNSSKKTKRNPQHKLLQFIPKLRNLYRIFPFMRFLKKACKNQQDVLVQLETIKLQVLQRRLILNFKNIKIKILKRNLSKKASRHL